MTPTIAHVPTGIVHGQPPADAVIEKVPGNDSAQFVEDVGIQLDRGKKPEIKGGRMVACRFGDQDQEFGYQAVLHCRVVDPADYRTVPTPKLNRLSRSGSTGMRILAMCGVWWETGKKLPTSATTTSRFNSSCIWLNIPIGIAQRGNFLIILGNGSGGRNLAKRIQFISTLSSSGIKSSLWDWKSLTFERAATSSPSDAHQTATILAFPSTATVLRHPPQHRSRHQ